MKLSAQELRLHDARTHELGFLAAALGAFAIAAAICNGATPTQDTTEPIWPTKEWQMSTPETEGMDSKELAKLVDFGTVHRFDSLLVVRNGKLVVEAYYAPYTAGIPHSMYSVTKAVISTLTVGADVVEGGGLKVWTGTVRPPPKNYGVSLHQWSFVAPWLLTSPNP
jgi:hypothetical protein